MSLSTIIPFNPLSEAEETELLRIFSNPVVTKYLRSLGQEDSKDLLSLGILDMPAEGIARRHSYISGKLSVVQTLLSISEKE